MSKIIFRLNLLIVLLAFLSGSWLMADPFTELDPNSEIESVKNAKVVSFSVDPLDKPVRIKQLGRLTRAAFITVNKDTTCTIVPINKEKSFVIDSSFSGVTYTSQSVFKKGYSILLGTYNNFSIKLIDSKSNGFLLRCDSSFIEMPALHMFQEAFAKFGLKLNVGFSE